ncbi:hypothetical protein RND81_02G241600 [Saponaria officinalis]|uniref:Uncharacterized protein n=1 Tax=Saponaria officinalis TaxID=3572 RepID=A0AAW1MYF5_SAPOF
MLIFKQLSLKKKKNSNQIKKKERVKMKQQNTFKHNNKIIDESESYFSYILSPFKKNKNKEKLEKKTQISQKVDRVNINHGDHISEDGYCGGDVDKKAEVFLLEQRKKFNFSKMFSRVR